MVTTGVSKSLWRITQVESASDANSTWGLKALKQTGILLKGDGNLWQSVFFWVCVMIFDFEGEGCLSFFLWWCGAADKPYKRVGGGHGCEGIVGKETPHGRAVGRCSFGCPGLTPLA